MPTFALWWLSCAEVQDPDGTTPGITPTATTPTTGTTGPPPDPTGATTATTSPPVDLCLPDAAVTVVSAEALAGRLRNQQVIDVTTSAETAVAIQCTSVADPADVHLLEDAGGTTEHSFDLGGLLLDDHYDCLAAAICPQSYDDPVAFGFDVGRGPPELVPATVEIDPVLGMTGAYTLFNLEECGVVDLDWIQLVDPQGRIRWWHAIDSAPNVGLEVRHQGGGIMTWGGGYTSVGRPRRVDVFAGEIYDSAITLTDYESTVFHHDGKELEDGRIMTLETETTSYEGSSFEGFALRLHDPVTQTVSWEYSSQTAVDAGELCAGSAVSDVWHANWADVIVEGGLDRLYVSLCHFDQVLKIDPVAGSVEWTFGPGGDFALQDANGSALADIEYPSCQHGLEVSGDRLLVYDNGRSRLESRIAEYELDTTTMTATELWTWTDGWYLSALGDVDYLDNDRVLLQQARLMCGNVPTKIIEIVPTTGEVASTVSTRPSDASYRAERLDGCELFSNAAYCPDVAARVAELSPAFTLENP